MERFRSDRPRPEITGYRSGEIEVSAQRRAWPAAAAPLEEVSLVPTSTSTGEAHGLDPDLVVHAARAIVGEQERAISVAVRAGRIVAVQPLSSTTLSWRAHAVARLADDEVLLPGLVDAHVHVNEPGRTSWEGFETATRAAAAGGVTTIVDMPLNSVPPTVDAAALGAKQDAARGRIAVDVAFWGGAIGTNLGELESLHSAGVAGFKCFMADSGVPEFPPVDDRQLEQTLAEAARLDALVVVHAEDPQVLAAAPPATGRRFADFLRSRPPVAEDRAIERLLAHAARTGARVHVLHLASAGALPAIAAARADGVRVTAETCPHYLTLDAASVPDGATAFKCCPPIREAGHQDALWAALIDGTLSCVVSDHSPCVPELKALDSGDFGLAWGGIASLQIGLSAVWTAAQARGVPLATVVSWMAQRPAELAGLPAKGRIAVGADADLVVLAPEATFVVDPARLLHRNPITPYAGRQLRGVVRTTWLRGVRVNTEQPGGRMLRRGAA
jgi:allantoinase